jgi:antitoxin component YwqK of YwqJK toxin-antitoxin module
LQDKPLVIPMRRLLRYSFGMKHLLIPAFLIPLLLVLQQPLWAQTDTTSTTSLVTDKPLTINFEEEEEEEEEIPEKKPKKNVFYDIKTRKGFSKTGYGDAEKIALFYLLKEWEAPDPYVRDIYWYEYKSKSVKVGGNPTPDKGMLLHGPYKVMRGGQLIEEGIIYKGTKHGRWITYRKMYDYYVLDAKEKYFRGWPKESKITYYDASHQKIREVVPIEYGKKEGNYFYFFEDGRLAVRGEYQYDQKVGTWTEFYAGPKQKRKRIVQYPATPWQKEETAFILQEWDKEGKLLYEAKKSR